MIFILPFFGIFAIIIIFSFLWSEHFDLYNYVKKQALIFILIFGLYNHAYTQLPVGKNIKTAKSEITEFLKSKGYHFLKSEKFENGVETLLFSEEFRIVLQKNSYDNVALININTLKKQLFARIKITFNFSQWSYIGEVLEGSNETGSIYAYKNYKIRIPQGLTNYQIIVKLDE